MVLQHPEVRDQAAPVAQGEVDQAEAFPQVVGAALGKAFLEYLQPFQCVVERPLLDGWGVLLSEYVAVRVKVALQDRLEILDDREKFRSGTGHAADRRAPARGG